MSEGVSGGDGISPEPSRILNPEAAGVHSAADFAEHAGEGAERISIDEAKRRGLDAAKVMFKMMVPSSDKPEQTQMLNDAIESTHLGILTKISEKAIPGSENPITLASDEAIDVAAKLGNLGIGKNHPNIVQFLEDAYPMLDDATREDIKRNLPDVESTLPEKDDEDQAHEALERQETLQAADERLDEIGGDMTAELNNDKEPPTDERKREISHNLVKLSKLKTRISGFFAEGEPGRKYARIGGKVLYLSLIAAFILFVIELNIINKAASNKRR